ncbi:dienelactone hydrolase family protein [Prosthecomicrobium pneumaticum]|uniref:Carboxymethylenebutenolidase n=1 Tax=Prosthecomicrobium pneumaticum TaxID=81895 RepID=A0A7W9CUU5_9HYPH|nr:dienelactone hydrolase family protein [Prosthecomicrobium pneumaticum]MBB5751996.1 carboxymethylenebutenolidase [Prosthecomicrobium pneumaticum]
MTERPATARPKITQEMIRLYDEYTHLTLDRRGFMEKLTRIAGSTAAAATIAPLLAANSAHAAIVAADDDRIVTERVSLPADGGTLSGLLAHPKEATGGHLPAVLVIHENRGLNPHIEDVSRRLAVEGFLALGADFLSPAGGTPADEDRAREMIGALDPAATLTNAIAAVTYLKGHALSNGRVGAVGFCWGGGLVNRLAAAAPDLRAAVAYYGMQPPAEAAAQIKARVMLHYAGLDERINAGIPAYEAALAAAGVDHQIFVYDGVNHAFNNDTSAARYDKAAADLAWSRTIAFLKETLATAT